MRWWDVSLFGDRMYGSVKGSVRHLMAARQPDIDPTDRPCAHTENLVENSPTAYEERSSLSGYSENSCFPYG